MKKVKITARLVLKKEILSNIQAGTDNAATRVPPFFGCWTGRGCNSFMDESCASWCSCYQTACQL